MAVNDGYDSREQAGMTLAFDTAFRTLIYDLYSKDISIKVKTAFDSKCAAGEYVFGQVPMGYEKSRKVKIPLLSTKERTKIVRYVFAMAADGMSSGQIARRLFEEKVPTAMQLRYPGRDGLKENHTWSGSMVRRILSNRFIWVRWHMGKVCVNRWGVKKEKLFLKASGKC